MKCEKRKECPHVGWEVLVVNETVEKVKTQTHAWYYGIIGAGLIRCWDCGLTLHQINKMREKELSEMKVAISWSIQGEDMGR